MALSAIDRAILRILQNDGRITYSDLARQVGLSTSPCIERVRKLERQGYISRYSALLNPDKLDAGLVVFVMIRMDRTSKNNFDSFRRSANLLPEVQECYLTTGNFDYLIKARVRDIAEYRDLLEDTLLSIEGVQETTSIVAMEAVKESLTLNI
ncbi:MAG: winged helix-turn-helix transcriptional regulator [Gammaproteobacteria bacterium]|nr:winged helix-turn-helix transcriptional regulator [Gammaproteobacteria bacterium]